MARRSTRIARDGTVGRQPFQVASSLVIVFHVAAFIGLRECTRAQQAASRTVRCCGGDADATAPARRALRSRTAADGDTLANASIAASAREGAGDAVAGAGRAIGAFDCAFDCASTAVIAICADGRCINRGG
ncbi:MAG: hypothetical protein ABI650_09650 [Dokdonella sp.]